MRVKELKQLLENFDDNDVVLILDKKLTTKLSEVENVKYKDDGVVSGFMTYETQCDDWDTTEEFENERNACLLTSEGYYVR